MKGKSIVYRCVNAAVRVSRKAASDLYNRLGLLTHWNVPKIAFQDPEGKRVLILIDSIGRAGAQRVASYLASGLADKCSVVLMTYRENEKTYRTDPRVHLMCMPKFNYGRKEKLYARYLRNVKKIYQIDVSLSMLYIMNCLNVCTKGEERVIVSERNNPMIAYPDRYQKCREIYDQADHVIFQTEEVRSMFSETTRAHSSVLPNPVSVTCYAGDTRKQRIVNAARLHKNKNQELLIRAFAAFLPGHSGYTLSFYGDGPEESALRKLAQELGVGDRVIFHGNVPDIHEQIADAGIFVLSSNVEGMSNALLEAMMMGLPCISTNCTGSKEVIHDGDNGLLVEMGNVQALTDAMAYMADHPEEADRMRRKAMQTAEAFRKEKVTLEWERLVLGV